jgi:hypothetical protein
VSVSKMRAWFGSICEIDQWLFVLVLEKDTVTNIKH